MSIGRIETLINWEGSHILISSHPPLFSSQAAYSPCNVNLFTELLKPSQKLNPAFLGWEQVRKNGIPLGSQDSCFSNKHVSFNTGFEGYFVGQVSSEEQLLNELTTLGVEIWDRIQLKHKRNKKRISRLEAQIRMRTFDELAIREWEQIFVMTLARCRARLQMNNSFHARSFRDQTKVIATSLPDLSYEITQEGGLKQTYALQNIPGCKRIGNPTGLSEQKAFGFLIMQELGKFGHPLIRTFLNYKVSDHEKQFYNW